jgi:hypothetical protein
MSTGIGGDLGRAPAQREIATRRALLRLAGLPTEFFFTGALGKTPTGQVDVLDSGVVPGVYGDSTHLVQITVDKYGRITSAVPLAILQQLVIGEPVVGSVVEELLYVDDSLSLAQSGNVRYKGWQFHKNNGQPTIGLMSSGEFAFSLSDAPP